MTYRTLDIWDKTFANAVVTATSIANDPAYAQLVPVVMLVTRDDDVKIFGLVGENPRFMGNEVSKAVRDHGGIGGVVVMEAVAATDDDATDVAVIHGVCGHVSRTIVYTIDRSQPPGERTALCLNAQVPDFITRFFKEALEVNQ